MMRIFTARQYLSSLTQRERLLLLIVFPAALLVAFWYFIWLPINESRAARTQDIATYRLLYAAAQTAADPTAAAGQSAVNTAPPATRITQSADAAQLTLRRLEPEGDRLLVTIDDADFSAVILWLADLETEQSIGVVAIELDRRAAPGMVSARITLEPIS